MEKGSKHTSDTIRKLVESHKGQSAWNEGKTKETSESLRKLSNSLKGRKFSYEWRKNLVWQK